MTGFKRPNYRSRSSIAFRVLNPYGGNAAFAVVGIFRSRELFLPTSLTRAAGLRDRSTSQSRRRFFDSEKWHPRKSSWLVFKSWMTPPAFSTAAIRKNLASSKFASTKLPLVTSPNRPTYLTQELGITRPLTVSWSTTSSRKCAQ